MAEPIVSQPRRDDGDVSSTDDGSRTSKAPYQSPTLVAYGSIREITQAKPMGGMNDRVGAPTKT